MKADFIVGLGGGSSMDTAKAIAVIITHGGKPSDYFGADTLTKPIAPLVCVPTTSGTGSEVTPFAVITDSKTRVKMNILDSGVVPTSSFVDPELTVSMPAGLTASTGMDALTHAVEAYTCKLANPLTDALAMKAVRIIAGSLRRAVADGSDADARNEMALGSLIAGYAFGNADVGGVHCMAEAIGGFYDTPHGVANSVFLPLVTEFNVPFALRSTLMLQSRWEPTRLAWMTPKPQPLVLRPFGSWRQTWTSRSSVASRASRNPTSQPWRS